MTDEYEPNPWAEMIGPCYTTDSIARSLGWTEAEVLEAAQELRLLRLQTDECGSLFPAFQAYEGEVIDGLQDVLRVLRTGVDDPWTWAQWLNTEMTEENPRRAIDLLRLGRVAEAIRDAQHDAWAWRS